MNKSVGIILLAGLLVTVAATYFVSSRSGRTTKPPRQIVTFYGKVVDQDGRPLSAEIHVQVSQEGCQPRPPVACEFDDAGVVVAAGHDAEKGDDENVA